MKDRPSYESRIPSRFHAASPGSRSARRSRGGAAPSSMLDEGVVQHYGSTLSFLGLTLGVFVSRKFLVMPVAVALTYVMDALRRVVEREAATARR